MNVLLNLNEGKFPIKINESYDLQLTSEIKILDYIEVDISIEKPSHGIVYAKGTLNFSYISECSSCSKNLTNEVKIETDVEIQDISVSLEKKYKNKDVHFQNLNEFEIKEFIREEIYLNIPNITFCEDKDCNHENINKKADLTKPFKKIRDLIK